jgi:hypothetical protein
MVGVGLVAVIGMILINFVPPGIAIPGITKILVPLASV